MSLQDKTADDPSAASLAHVAHDNELTHSQPGSNHLQVLPAHVQEEVPDPVLARTAPFALSDDRLHAGRSAVPYDRRRGDRRRSVQADQIYQVAVLLPCRDEALTIGAVVRDFAAALPQAKIWVFDNNSSDETIAEAQAAGALVHHETKPGKGHVLRRMFSEIEADVYVIADGDGTYEAQAAPTLIQHLLDNRLDMVVGRRKEVPADTETYRPGHRLGNAVLTGVVQNIFGHGSLDMLSGYRVLSRRYVKSFPANSCRFETETEMTVHALDLGLPFSELDTVYRERPTNSHSKLRTIPDGVAILRFILLLVKDYRPAQFFGLLGAFFAILAVLARFVFYHSITSLMNVATARGVVTGLIVVTAMLFGAGLILDSLSRARRDLKRMMYLNAGTERRAEAAVARNVSPGPNNRRSNDRG
jgi:glycosyltransferase involved in cell wall biosynthesis